jgi:hypothetical protein
MFGGKALRLAAQNSRPHAALAPMRSAPSYFKIDIEDRYQLHKYLN